MLITPSFSPVQGGDDLRDVMTAGRINSIETGLQDVRKGNNITASGKDVFVTRGPHGVNIRIRRGRNAGQGSLDNFVVGFRSDTLAFGVSYGTVRGMVPKLGGVALGTSPEPTGSLTGTGIEKVYLQVTTALTKTSDNTYVRSWSLTSVTVEAVSGLADIGDVPTADDLSSGIYNCELATFVDGIKIEPQAVRTSLNFFIEDDQSGTGQGQIYFFRS
jgi:hypothetical protein